MSRLKIKFRLNKRQALQEIAERQSSPVLLALTAAAELDEALSQKPDIALFRKADMTHLGRLAMAMAERASELQTKAERRQFMAVLSAMFPAVRELVDLILKGEKSE